MRWKLRYLLTESFALLIWAALLLIGAGPFDSSERYSRCDGTTISCVGNVFSWTGNFYPSSTSTGFTIFGAQGNWNVNYNGTVVSFSRAGYNYIAADASNAVLVLQADGAGGVINTQAGTLNFYAANGTTLLATLTGTAFTFVVPAQLPASTVSALPSCVSGLAGAIAYVTDASSPGYNAALTGGSSTKTLAMCNGSGWVAH